MFCDKCGKKVDKNWQFCPYCEKHIDKEAQVNRHELFIEQMKIQNYFGFLGGYRKDPPSWL